jgi:hypothetical protein
MLSFAGMILSPLPELSTANLTVRLTIALPAVPGADIARSSRW